MDHDGHNDGAHGTHGGHTTHEALFIANIGGHSHGAASFAYHGGHGCGGNTGHGPQIEAISPQGRTAVNVPLKDEHGEAIRGYICHVSRHGQLDILSRFHKIALSADLVRIDGKRPGFDPSDRQMNVILDYDAWKHAQELTDGQVYDVATFGERQKPNGWYPGATGSTSLIREYWQVGKRKHLFGNPEFDNSASTYLEVSVITWYYYECADFETKLEVRIISAPEWSDETQTWGYRAKPFEEHQRVAVSIYTKLMDMLSETKPTRVAEALRASMDAKFPQRNNVPEGTYAMTGEEILEREMEAVAEDARGDQVSRDNSSRSQPAAPAAGETADVTVELED